MNKQYAFFFAITFLSSSLLICSEEEISYEDQMVPLKTELTQLQEQRDNLLSTLQKELEKSKSSFNPFWYVLNPVFILWVSNFIKDPSFANFIIFMPHLIILSGSSWVSSQSNETATSLIAMESMIKQKQEKIKKLKNKIRMFD